MRTVDPELWYNGVRKRIPSGLASFYTGTTSDRRRRNIMGLTPNYEKIFRKSVRETANEYLRCSSLPGTSCLKDEHRTVAERIILFILLLLGLGSVSGLINFSVRMFSEKPIIVNLESDQHPAYEVSFPAVGVCSSNLISKRTAMQVAHETVEQISRWQATRANRSRIPIPNAEKVYEAIRRIGYLLDYQTDDYNDLILMLQLMEKIDNGSVIPEMSEFIKNVACAVQAAPQCEDLLVRCSWGGRQVACSDLFTLRKTVYGPCCTFNYVRRHNTLGEPFGVTKKPLKVPSIGFNYGLSVIAKTDIDDYAYTKYNNLGIHMLIFSPLDFPDETSGAMTSHVTLTNSTTYLSISSQVQYSTAGVKSFGLKSRGCRFREELPEQFHGHYSQSECITACRLRTTFALCHCAPITAPYSGTLPRCNLYSLPCLHKHKEKFLYMFPNRPDEDGLLEESQNSLFCPECYPDCEYERYSVKQFLTRNTDSKYVLRTNLTAGLDLTNMTVIHVFYPNEDQLLYKMDVIYYWYEFMSHLGGLSSLLAGASIMSILEIFYFCFYRFFVVWKKNKKFYFNKRLH